MGGLIAAEIYIIVEGTFFSLSWDIMEPISYMMTLGNSVLLVSMYFAYISNPKIGSFMEYIQHRMIKKYQRKAGIDPNEIK